jgi:hypothetical protein
MSWINLTALWKIVVYGLIAGAGLPALFSVGLYSLSRGPRLQAAGEAGVGGAGEISETSDAVYGGSIIGLAIAVIIALAILAAIGWGIYEVYQIGHPPVKK